MSSNFWCFYIVACTTPVSVSVSRYHTSWSSLGLSAPPVTSSKYVQAYDYHFWFVAFSTNSQYSISKEKYNVSTRYLYNCFLALCILRILLSLALPRFPRGTSWYFGLVFTLLHEGDLFNLSFYGGFPSDTSSRTWCNILYRTQSCFHVCPCCDRTVTYNIFSWLLAFPHM